MYDYVKQHRWAKLRVGLVITLAVVTVFFAVMFAGNIEKFFSPKVKIYTLFNDIKGLREGSPVWFSGVEIGSVKSMHFTIQKKIQVEMLIASDTLKLLKKDSRANILTLGLLGDKYVELIPGSSEAASLKGGDTIMGQTTTEIQDVVETSQASIAKIADFINTLEGMIEKMEKSNGTVSKLLSDPSVHDNLKETTKELSGLLRKMESGEGTISRLVNEGDVYSDLSSSVKDIKLFAKSLRESDGTLNKLIADPALYNRFQEASENLDSFTRKLVKSKGTVNKLIEDESLYDNINSVSIKLGALLESVDKGEGVVGSLMKDEDLSKELKSTLRELNALIKDVKEHPGKYFKFSLF
ncbi:MAG: MCE family protein [Nitrospirae bacterium]|nr:MCE family protein [Nitrospirota bacterium]